MTAVLTPTDLAAAIRPDDVRDVLARSILADGLDLVLDIDRSSGSYLVDARTGERYLDMFTFFASSALGMNHPALADDEDFRAELAQAAVNKPSNSDIYSVPMARFVATFARVLGDPALPHLFFVDGGALAVENALKVAFDWKSRHNEAHGIDPDLGTKVLHLRGAFHGRSGYTLSLTNTDPNKVARFPKFDWPRIDAPYLRPGADMDAVEAESLRQARAAFEAHPHDIACFIAEPIQGEGGDRHFRPQFFAAMRDTVRRVRRAADLRRGADRLRDDRNTLGLPAIGGNARCGRIRQEDPGVRRHGRRPGRRGGRQRLRGELPNQLHVGRQSRRHGALAAHPGDHRVRRADGARGQGGSVPPRPARRRSLRSSPDWCSTSAAEA